VRKRRKTNAISLSSVFTFHDDDDDDDDDDDGGDNDGASGLFNYVVRVLLLRIL
jgi:hypothetical protein